MSPDTILGSNQRYDALADMKVLEVANSLSARFCGLLLAELGAEVWAYIDNASRADWLSDAPSELLHQWLCGYKHEIPPGCAGTAPALLPSVVERADLLVTDQLGDRLPWLNTIIRQRRLPTIAITPFGLSGPRVPNSGIDLLASHASGYAYHLAGAWPERPPIRGPVGQAEMLAGLVGAVAALSRSRHGSITTPQAMLDVSVQEANSSLLFVEVSEYDSGILTAKRDQNAMLPTGLVLILQAADGAVMVSPREQHLWDRMMSVLHISGCWVDDVRFRTPAMRLENWRELQRRISEFTRDRAKEELCSLLQDARVPCFPINSVSEALQEPNPRSRGFWSFIHAKRDREMVMPGLPFRLVDAANKGNMYRIEGEGQSIAMDSDMPTGPDTLLARCEQSTNEPLKGIRVIDFSWVIAGPTCTRLLALLGAEVIKIESRSRPEHTSRRAETDLLNISKKSITVDLKHPVGRSIVRDLIRHSDCVVENFGPGVMERLGLSWQELADIRPGLVMLSMSGLGKSGAGSSPVAYGSLLQGYAGWTAQISESRAGRPVVGERPMGVRPVWADQIVGLLGSLGILTSLRRRSRTGSGQYIDLSMFEGLLLMESVGIAIAESGASPNTEWPLNSSARAAPHGCYRCKGDDQWIAMAVSDDDQWKRLVALLGFPKWAHGLETVRSRLAAAQDIDRRLSSWTVRHDPEEVLDALRRIDVPAARSNSIEALFEDPLMRDRSMLGLLRDGRHCICLPWLESTAGRKTLAPAPVVGEDTAEVLNRVLGFDADMIRSLEKDGALGRHSPPARYEGHLGGVQGL